MPDVKDKLEIKVVSAAWCSQCNPYKKTLDSAKIEYEVIDADDDTQREFLQAEGIRGLPTTLIMRNGVVLTKATGSMSPAAVLKLLVQAGGEQ